MGYNSNASKSPHSNCSPRFLHLSGRAQGSSWLLPNRRPWEHIPLLQLVAPTRPVRCNCYVRVLVRSRNQGQAQFSTLEPFQVGRGTGQGLRITAVFHQHDNVVFLSIQMTIRDLCCHCVYSLLHKSRQPMDARKVLRRSLLEGFV
jgi:DNA-directed RNA polymerase subunit RPC12/RpoP